MADADGCVLEVNPAACPTFGDGPPAAIGRELAGLIVPPERRSRHREGLGRYLRSDAPHVLDQRLEISAMRSAGTVFPFEPTITRTALGGPPVFTGYLRDLT